MKIGIQLTPDGRRFEFDLVPDDELWRLNPVGRNLVNRRISACKTDCGTHGKRA